VLKWEGPEAPFSPALVGSMVKPPAPLLYGTHSRHRGREYIPYFFREDLNIVRASHENVSIH
jgi:hypothetical protein